MNTLGFLGVGNMGGAILRGLHNHDPKTGYVYYDIAAARCEELAADCGLFPENSMDAVMEKADGVFIAVKPQVYPALADTVAACYKEGQILISIMAGVTLDALGQNLPDTAKIIRLMPNMAMTVKAGVCLFAANANVTEAEKTAVKEMLSAMGMVKELPEHLMDCGTAISGSGPAFFYSMVEAMTLGGIKEGFTRDDALQLTIHTMKGAAALLEQTEKSPGELRDEMLSAGGTTIAGVCALEQGSFRRDVVDAVAASTHRSKELRGGGKK